MHPAYFETHFLSHDGLEGWPEKFAIITAHATTGETWSNAQNEQADRALEAALQSKQIWMRRVTGYSPATGHAEPGWAAALHEEEARKLGQAFLQDAIYIIHGDTLWVTHCDERHALHPVGSFRARLTPA